jgi:hypothetical protein
MTINTEPTPAPMPEVRQCQDPASPFYGCVAVKSGVPTLAWGVFNPKNGGHWDNDDSIVKDWKVMA